MNEPIAQPAPPGSVLILKPSSLGDVVSAVPVLRGLKRSLPSARVSWLLNRQCAPLLAGDADLDEIILFDRKLLGRAWRSPSAARSLAKLLRHLRKTRFDWVIDLQGLLRSGLLSAATLAPLRAGFSDAREGAWLFYNRRIDVGQPHTVDRNIELARQLGIDARPEDMTLSISAEGQTFAEQFCRANSLKNKGFLLCVPPTRWATKLYPVRHWRSVVLAMLPRLPVVLIGTLADRQLCQEVAEGLPATVINAAGTTSVPQLVALIAAAAGVVCGDSAAQFIAPAVGTDVVTLMGPTRPERTGPYRRGRAVVSPVGCQGCLRDRCRHRTCMEMIDPAAVVQAATAMLDLPATPPACPGD